MPRSHHVTLDLQSGPPPEVLAEIDAAWGRAQVPFDDGLELQLETDAGAHRAFGELRRADGTVAYRLTASEVVALACGDPIGPRRTLAV